MTTLRIEPTSDAAASVSELWSELWTWVERVIRSNATGKAAKQITTAFLDDAVSDLAGVSSERELRIAFRDPGGLSAMSAIAAAHWTRLALSALGEQLDSVMADLGYRFAEELPALSSVLEDGSDPPLVEVTGSLYAVRAHDAEVMIIGDEGAGAAGIAELTRAQQNKVRAVLESGCACPMCKKARKGGLKLPDVAADRQKAPRSTHFKSVRSALKWKHRARSLRLDGWTGEVPETVGELRGLERLDVGENHLSDLPGSLVRLTELRELNLSLNRFETLPSVVCRLSELRALDLGSNPLKELPDEIAELTELRQLRLSFSPAHPVFGPFPAGLAKLRALEDLDLCLDGPLWSKELIELDWGRCFPKLRRLNLLHSQWDAVAAGLRGCAHLEHLALTNAPIATLPDWFGELRNLTYLSLARTSVTELPASIEQLTSLTWLVLGDTRVTHIPGLSKMRALTHLYLDGSAAGALESVLPALGSLPSLTHLYARSAEIPQRVKAEIPERIRLIT